MLGRCWLVDGFSELAHDAVLFDEVAARLAFAQLFFCRSAAGVLGEVFERYLLVYGANDFFDRADVLADFVQALCPLRYCLLRCFNSLSCSRGFFDSNFDALSWVFRFTLRLFLAFFFRRL